MPIVTFVSPEGRLTPCVAAAGTSLMLAALVNGVDGVLAECGGALACGTCHVYVAPYQIDRLPPPDAAEDAMLGMTASPRLANSRLSCQIVIDAACEGLIVHLPDRQV